MWQSKQIFSPFVYHKLSVLNLILLNESSELLNGVVRGNSLHHWSFSLKLSSEIMNVLDEFFYIELQCPQVIALLLL